MKNTSLRNGGDLENNSLRLIYQITTTGLLCDMFFISRKHILMSIYINYAQSYDLMFDILSSLIFGIIVLFNISAKIANKF